VRRALTDGLLGRIRRPARGDTNSSPPLPGDGSGKRTRHHRPLDWMAVLARLGPVRHRWDLAIICNLDETAGRRPADLLAAINSQSAPERQLSPQVLSGRLRSLERDGYVRHVDLSVMPLHRVYFLQPPGVDLISDLLRITNSGSALPSQPTVAVHDER
jgi:DNA-binding HxlR family transcriptional regulator